VSGQIHAMIEAIVESRSHGDEVAAAGVRVRLLLRGIDPNQYGPASDDDPVIVAKLKGMMTDFDSTGALR
jgi:hypothetical protein